MNTSVEQLTGPVLVTGATGFLGCRLVRRLMAAGRPVRALVRREVPELTALGVELVRADLTETAAVRAACEGMETVFHTAAKVGVWGSAAEYRKVNVEGTLAVLNGCRDFLVRRLVYTSTPSVVFNGRDLSGSDETLPYGKDFPCHYPATKARAERMVREADDVPPGHLRTVALRPHLIWGPGDPHLVPRVLERARKGRLRIVGEGKNRVDLTYIDNAVDAHLLAETALDRPPGDDHPGGKAFFITNGEPVVLWEWINDLLPRAGLPPVTRRLTLKAARRIGAAAEAVWAVLRLRGEPPMTRFVAAELAKDHWFSITAAERCLGYRPRVTMAEGLKTLTAGWPDEM
ncbi:MAG: NAD-dependent epimerase/dehydratase family protein [Puniceicoccaceae bacterium]|nr:MAG: NAD-dependent epimerase/dehydratase family protein [Puniceicoccaceae bacterium]